MDEHASAGTISFVIALSLFLGGVGYVVLSGQEVGEDPEPADTARDRAGAESLADLLVGSPGIGWPSGPDALTRLGLQAENGSGLSSDHLALMRGGVFDATGNGLLDYDEARLSLGLAPGEDFHIRIYPPNLEAFLLQADLSHLRLAYIGDWPSTPSAGVPLGSASAMASAARAQMDAQMSSVTDDERASIADLPITFGDRVYLDYAGWDMQIIPQGDPLHPDLSPELYDGDVYPDHKQYLDAVLPGRLPLYDVLIVGSGVDQSTLTANVVKNGIRDWTMAGGNLIVLGSDAQNFQWIQPLFSVGTSTVNGGAVAPDVNHPALLQPHELSWPDYDNHGLGWDIKDQGSGAHYDDFSHVIVEDGEDVLAISDEGAFGSGRIFLTTYRPGELVDFLGIEEASAFFLNMVLYHDRSDLYLDYGPSVPSDQAVSQAVRLSHVWDVDIGQVPLRVEVLYWRSA